MAIKNEVWHLNVKKSNVGNKNCEYKGWGNEESWYEVVKSKIFRKIPAQEYIPQNWGFVNKKNKTNKTKK